MKINFTWGTGITIFLVAFLMLLIGFFIWTLQFDVQLVTEDYYGKELVYQEHISKVNRTLSLSEQPVIIKKGEFILIEFPAELTGSTIAGMIEFYRPSDKKKDFKVPLIVDKELKAAVDVSGTEPGLWTMKMDWSANDSLYYNEMRFMF